MSFLVNVGLVTGFVVAVVVVVEMVESGVMPVLAVNNSEGFIMGKTKGVPFRSSLGLSFVVVDLIGDFEMGKATLGALLNSLGLVGVIDLVLFSNPRSSSNDPARACRPSTATSSKSKNTAVSGVFNSAFLAVLVSLLILPHLDSAGTGESILQFPHVELASLATESTVAVEIDEKVDEVDDRRRSSRDGGMGESLIPWRVRLNDAEG